MTTRAEAVDEGEAEGGDETVGEVETANLREAASLAPIAQTQSQNARTAGAIAPSPPVDVDVDEGVDEGVTTNPQMAARVPRQPERALLPQNPMVAVQPTTLGLAKSKQRRPRNRRRQKLPKSPLRNLTASLRVSSGD